MHIFKWVSCLLLTAALAGCNNESTENQSSSSNNVESNENSALLADINTQNEIPAACGNGGLALRDTVAVTGSHDVHVDANLSPPLLKNEKASAILERDHFHQIDNSTTVRRLCVQEDWTEVQIQTPEWLTHVVGWVPSSVLREIEHNDRGGRIYVEDDFSWDEDTSSFKQQITATVNTIAAENRHCSYLDTGTLAKSSTRSTPNDPVFFITCGTGADVFNVWFRPSDVEDGATFAAREPLGKNAAADACEAVAKQAATHPSTVSFSRVWDLAYLPHVSGRARIVSSFTAKNAFNLELEYRIDCLFDGPTLIETNISESI